MATGAQGGAVGHARPLRERLQGTSPATLFFVAAALVSAVVLLSWLSDLTFWRDEWEFLLHRRGISLGTFLEPHYEHISIAPIAIYKTLLVVFGMDSPTPYQLASTAMFLTSIALLFVYLRRRVGGWLALAGSLPLLFFGPSWDDLLWPFQIGYFGSVGFGLGALLALDREDRRGDLVACLLLVISMTFSSLGIPFAIGIAVLLATGGEVRRRAFVVVIPVALFALWWLAYGRDSESYVSLHNLVTAPSYVLDGFGSSLSSLLGLATPRDEIEITALDWGRPLLIGGLALAALRLYRLGRIPWGVWIAVALGTAFWFLAALNASLFRHPESGRYQYVGAIFVLLIAAELMRGVRVSRWLAISAIGVGLIAAASNLNYLHQYWNGIKRFGQQQPGGLAALEIVRDRVDPAFQLTEQNSDVDYLGELDAGSYLSAVDKYGSPAYTPAELEGASEQARVAADKVAASALELGLVRTSGAALAGCTDGVTVEPREGGSTIELPPGGASLRAASGAKAEIALGRFAETSFPVAAGTLPAGRAVELAVPTDRSTRPWRANLQTNGSVEVCPLDQ